MQAGMMNMQEYMDFVQIDRMHTMKKDYQLNYKTTGKRNENEQDFDDVWDPGVKMNWMYTPVEKQKPQINWRQDINSADKSPKKLDSYQGANGPGASGNTPGVTLTGGNYKDFVAKHKQYMDDVLNGKHDKEAPGAPPTDSDKNDRKNASDTNSSSSSTSSDKKTSGRIKQYRVAKANGDSSSEQDYSADWQKVKDAIKEGFDASEKIVTDSVDNLKTIGYEQALQKECQDAKIDPVMAMAIIACESNGSPENEKGLFGDGTTGSVNDQIKKGVAKIKELILKYNKEGNPLGPVSAYKGWKDDLDKWNTKDTMFSAGWVKAAEGIVNPMSYFPKVIAVYQGIEKANTGLSQLTDTSDYVNPEFPFATPKLNEVYWTQDYGTENVDSGVVAVSNALVFKCPEGSELHAPEDAPITEFHYDEKIGNFIEIKGSTSKNTYIFGAMNSASDSATDKKAETIKKSSVVGVTTKKFILQVKDESGNYVDPKTVWRLLLPLKVTEETTIGQQIIEQNNVTKSASTNTQSTQNTAAAEKKGKDATP